MTRGTPQLDWEGLLWETRGYLGFGEADPVPLDELRETAEVNGWSEREFREAHRNSEQLVNVGTLDEPRVVLDDTVSDTNDGEPNTENDTPGIDTEESASNRVNNGEIRKNVDLDTPPEIGSGVFPEDLKGVAQWLTWKATDDGRKVPRAPYEHPDWPDKFVSAQDPDVWRDFDTAADWSDKLGGYGLAFTIRNREDYPDEQFVLVDYDDARDPDTGEVHPVVREHIERADSYTDVSTSGTGVHIFCRGELPDGVKAIGAELPADERFPGAEIEVYDSGRYSAMTGDHVVGTPRTTRECQSFIDDLADEFATVAEGTPDQLLHEPEKSKDELADVETTTDIQDVFDAIQHTGPRDIRLRSTVTHERGDGTKSLDPSWAQSKSGTRLAEVGDGWVYRKGMHGLGALQVVALEERIITRVDEYPTGEDFWAAVDALRQRGAHVPEYEPQAEGEQYAVLPNDDVLTQASSSWDWRHAGEVRDGLSIDHARNRTQDAITDAYESSDRVLIEALPTMGKTTGAIRAAADTGEQITYLCPRREVMKDVAQKARDAGLEVYTLPAFTRDCDTANGEHGDEWADTVRDWYNRGATPKDIHKNAEYELGRPLPCQEHVGQDCPYTSKWRFEPDDYDVLIGHYVHGHKPKVTQGRTVVFDEFPGSSYETVLGHTLEASVTAFLGAHDALPFEDYADLMEHRTDAERRAEALLWFDENEPEDNATIVFDSNYGHAKAPYAVFTILAAVSENLGNGWERCELPDGGLGLFDRENNVVRLMNPPRLTYTSGVVALDGTPTKRMWELTLGTRLNHRQVLCDDEREEYIRDVLNLNLVRTSEYMKPYNNPDYVHVTEDRALLEEIGNKHEQKPVLITTLAAENVYEDEGVLDETAEHEHYGNLKSSNEFASERLGCVIGSQHYGDGFIEKWGAYDGRCIERGDGKGVDLSYGAFGDRILSHMREHETLQAAMRFGRDGNGATVYVNTAALPDWVPLAGEGRVLTVWSDGMRQVLDAANGLDSWRTKEITDHPDVTISERQVREHLTTLAERGYLGREVEGRGYVWRDDGLHRVNEHGDVEIDAVEDEDVVAEVARKSIYTWEFRNSPGEHPGAASGPPSAGGDDAADVLKDGGCDDPPPG